MLGYMNGGGMVSVITLKHR